MNDLSECKAILRAGSKSFAAASRLLPRRVRDPAAAVYAFCRVADDAVDCGDSAQAGLADIHRRLGRAYAGHPDDRPVDRAFARVVESFAIPRAVPEALLEGFAWDVEGHTYGTLAELRAYCVRVAATVGIMMTLLMGRRDPTTLARACDLGVAMQLTNIARDVGEDARAGRLYLPSSWLAEAGIDAEAFLARPTPGSSLGRVVSRLLDAAERLYRRADGGIPLLPVDCRIAIRAARLIYADIGRRIRRARMDSVTRRAVVSTPRKLILVARAADALLLWPPPAQPPPLEEARFLIEPIVERPRRADEDPR